MEEVKFKQFHIAQYKTKIKILALDEDGNIWHGEETKNKELDWTKVDNPSKETIMKGDKDEDKTMRT